MNYSLPTVGSWKRPRRPDVTVPLELHRSHDGFVLFARKRSPEQLRPGEDPYEHLGAIAASRLAETFPAVRELFLEDAFFTINGYGTAQGLMSNRDPVVKAQLRRAGVRWASRRSWNVDYLTAAFTDIDCHALDIEVGTAIGHVINAQDRGLVPPATMFMRSGRGVWVFWFLHEAGRPDKPQRAFREDALPTWAAVQRKLSQLFAAVGSDRGAIDQTRQTRLPGSINTKADARVDYWFQARSGDKPAIVYTLPQLAEALGVEPITRKEPKGINARVRQIESQAGRRGNNGYLARWQSWRDQFNTLRELRGRFSESHRNAAVFLLAHILASLKVDKADADEALWLLFTEGLARGSSPMSRDEFESTVRSARARRSTVIGGGRSSMSCQYVADVLGITPQEKELLTSWPAASRFKANGSDEPPSFDELPRAEKARRRQENVRAIIDRATSEGLALPTLRELQELLLERAGIEATTATLQQDLLKLGVANPRRRKAGTEDYPTLFGDEFS